MAFTIARAPAVPNGPSSFAGMVRAIIRVEVADPLTLRLHTAAPAPILPSDLAIVAVVSRHAGEGATTEDYNNGRAAIGTGPFDVPPLESLSALRADRRLRVSGEWGSAAIIRNVFFFEKKKQKISSVWSLTKPIFLIKCTWALRTKGPGKVFWFFFSKKNAFLPLPGRRP